MTIQLASDEARVSADTQCRFLALAPELAPSSADAQSDPIPLEDANPPSPALPLSCKKVYDKTIQMHTDSVEAFWRSTHFVIDYCGPALPTLPGLTNAIIRELKSMSILTPHGDALIDLRFERKKYGSWVLNLAARELAAADLERLRPRVRLGRQSATIYVEESLRCARAQILQNIGAQVSYLDAKTDRGKTFHGLAICLRLCDRRHQA